MCESLNKGNEAMNEHGVKTMGTSRIGFTHIDKALAWTMTFNMLLNLFTEKKIMHVIRRRNIKSIVELDI